MIAKFNKEKEYKEEILPLIQELKKKCNYLEMPMFVTVCTQNNKEGTVYENDMINPVIYDAKLKENLFPHLVNVMNGFNTVPYEKPFEIEF